MGETKGDSAEPPEEITDPDTVVAHLEAALEATETESVRHHIRHALLYLGGE